MAYAQGCKLLLARAEPGATPKSIFGAAPDGLWLWANTQGLRELERLKDALPALPDDRMQRRFSGSTGDGVLVEGFRFYRLVKRQADLHVVGGWRACSDVVDFGCGWGRITRFFLREVDGEHLVGLDCLEKAVEWNRSTNRWSRFELVDPLPPSGLPDQSADVIYAYSVFSHLSETVHLAWLQDFHRALRPGGLMVVTTRPRRFVTRAERERAKRSAGAPDLKRATSASQAFADTDGWLERYDRGEFCHDATGGGPGLPDSFFGETLIPPAYVDRVWTRWFSVRDYISDPAQCAQDVIVAVKS
jgi:SAM-dependent methyltransferase